MFSALKSPQPFCPLCFRYMTPQQAKAHKQHARVIKWPKPAAKPQPRKK